MKPSRGSVDRESLVLTRQREFQKVIAKARAEFAAGKTLSWDEMKRIVPASRKTKEKGRS